MDSENFLLGRGWTLEAVHSLDALQRLPTSAFAPEHVTLRAGITAAAHNPGVGILVHIAPILCAGPILEKWEKQERIPFDLERPSYFFCVAREH